MFYEIQRPYDYKNLYYHPTPEQIQNYASELNLENVLCI